MQVVTKEKKSTNEVLIDSLAACDKATGVIIIVDSQGDGVYSLRSNLCTQEVCGLFEIAKHHLISNLEHE